VAATSPLTPSKPADPSACDLTDLTPGTVGSDGSFTIKKTVKVGVGGGCNAGDTCYIGAGATDQSESGSASFTFATGNEGGGGGETTTPTPTESTGGEATSVQAGSGGQAAGGDEGVPAGIIVLGAAGVLGLAAGAVRFARR